MNTPSKLLVVASLLLSSVAGASPSAHKHRHQPESASMPSADKIAPYIEARLGHHAQADVQLCVGTDGRVMSVALVRSTGFPAFDRAVLSDARDWRFATSDTSFCTHTKIEYRAHA